LCRAKYSVYAAANCQGSSFGLVARSTGYSRVSVLQGY
jgi:hypothetical protein